MFECSTYFKYVGRHMLVQHIAFGMSFFHSQISIDDLVLLVSFTTFRSKEIKEIEIGD